MKINIIAKYNNGIQSIFFIEKLILNNGVAKIYKNDVQLFLYIVSAPPIDQPSLSLLHVTFSIGRGRLCAVLASVSIILW